MIRARFSFALFTALAASAVLAQQLYRWTDEKGRVHITDTAPPASAKDVQKKAAAAGAADSSQMPFEVAQAMKDFPVVLYTSPSCKAPCSDARSALNRRGVPFSEVQVWDEKSSADLKGLSGEILVPTLFVGRSVQKGFQQEAYDALLDSARYPKAGSVPVRNQAAPGLPEGYAPDVQTAQPAKPEAEEKPTGPYSPGSRPPPRRTPPQK
jgi:glutaredoxin